MIIKACPGHPLLLGRLGENLALEIVFADEVAAWLSEYPNAAIGLLNQRPGDTQGYPVARAVVSGGALRWTVTNTDLSAEGNGKCELVATDNGVVVKSAIYDTIILTALDGSGETPKPWEDWREYFIGLKNEAEGSAEAAAGSATAAQEAAESVQDMGVEAETLTPGSEATVEKTVDPETGAVTLEFGIPRGAQGERGERGETGSPGPQGVPGTPGQDGVSPTATVTQTSTGATITITDAEGTTTAEISNGHDGAPGDPGADGISPTITITDIPGGHRVTIMDATGPHSFDVMDGEGAVQDVQVAGTSVVTDGVANVPMATTDSGIAGVVKVNAFNGLTMSGGVLTINSAYDTDIKAGTNMLRPITPGRQQQSTFYGLAKAAGDSTQSASSNPVGTYTESAKSAISQMLNGSVSVTGSTPTITALPGIRYVCGEVTTLDITLPVNGIVDVVFESGATPTVLSGLDNVRWAGDFDPDNLEANTTYEINIADGLGVAASWT